MRRVWWILALAAGRTVFPRQSPRLVALSMKRPPPPDSSDADASRLHANLAAARSQSSVTEAVEALKAEAEALATPQITPGGGTQATA